MRRWERLILFPGVADKASGNRSGKRGKCPCGQQNMQVVSRVSFLSLLEIEKYIYKIRKHAYTRVRVLGPLETELGNMQEKKIERRLVNEAKKRGGLAVKFVSPGFDGVPDRLVLLPHGKLAFVELKAPGKTLRHLQVRRKEQLEGLGFLVYCVDGTEQIGGILDEIQSS